jgi:hypothetical protein
MHLGFGELGGRHGLIAVAGALQGLPSSRIRVALQNNTFYPFNDSVFCSRRHDG